MGGPHVGSQLKFHYFVGSQLYFSPFVASWLTPFRPRKNCNVRNSQLRYGLKFLTAGYLVF